MIFLGVLMLTLISCQSLQSFNETNPSDPTITERGATFCEIAKPFWYSKLDTDKTKEQAIIHNAKGVQLCQWQGASPVVP